jgi:hypothetical protein
MVVKSMVPGVVGPLSEGRFENAPCEGKYRSGVYCMARSIRFYQL